MTRGEYIIRALSLVGRRLGAAPFGFKGAGFSSMRNPLRRHYGQGDLHFVTFSCYRRRPYLGTRRARDRFLKILDEVRIRHKFRIVGYVVMPEHVHLLVSEPVRGNPSKFLQVLKQKVSRELRKRSRKLATGQLPLRFPEDDADAAAFWQRRFYDFNVWSAKKVREKLGYMHANPVVRGLVKHPKDWPWSSWSFYAKGEEGLLRIDGIGEESRNTEAGADSRKSQNPHQPKRAAPRVDLAPDDSLRVVAYTGH
jgi:REP-associated tyrosine transposase